MNKGENNFDVGDTVMKGVAISGVGNVGLRVLDFASSVLMLNWLSIFEFGVYRLTLATYDFFTGFFLTGAENVIVSDVSRELGKNTKTAKGLFSGFFGLLLVAGVLLWSLFFFGGKWLSPFSVEEGYLRTVSFLFLLSPLETGIQLSLQIFLKFNRLAFYRALRNLVRFGALIFFFYFTSVFKVQAALWSLILSIALPLVFMLLTNVGIGRLFTIPSRQETKLLAVRFFRHGKWAIFEDFIANSGKNIYPFIVKNLVSVEAVAVLAVAQNLVAYIVPLFPIRDVLSPVFPRVADDPRRLASQVNRASKYAVVLYVIIGIIAVVLSPVLVKVFFSKYISSIPLLYILLLNLPWLGFRSVLLPAFYALREQKILFKITVFRILLTTLLGVALTYVFDIWGAAVGLMLVGVLITVPMTRALKTALPSWQFSISSLWSFDDYDREFLRKIKNSLKRKFCF